MKSINELTEQELLFINAAFDYEKYEEEWVEDNKKLYINFYRKCGFEQGYVVISAKNKNLAEEKLNELFDLYYSQKWDGYVISCEVARLNNTSYTPEEMNRLAGKY